MVAPLPILLFEGHCDRHDIKRLSLARLGNHSGITSSFDIMAATLDVNAHAYFLPRKDLYDSVKPYILEDTSDSVPRSNSHSERVDDILFRDLRGKEADLSFAKAGFGVLHHNTSLSYDDFFDPKLVYGVYCREIASCLLQYTGGCHVQIFDVNVSLPVITVLMPTSHNTCEDQSATRTIHCFDPIRARRNAA
jgi:hypothetical protein